MNELHALLQEATGLPASGRLHAHVRLDAELGARSLQRAGLELWGDTLVLAVWPGELKQQARELYGTDRAARLLDLVAAGASGTSGWRAEPRPHLGFYGASRGQRLHLTTTRTLPEYVAGWSEDLGRIHAYPPAALRGDVWPWLVDRGYAAPADADGLPRFERLLGRRQLHIRPAIRVLREWPPADADRLDERGELPAAIGAALCELLDALDEPDPVASAA